MPEETNTLGTTSIREIRQERHVQPENPEQPPSPPVEIDLGSESTESAPDSSFEPVNSPGDQPAGLKPRSSPLGLLAAIIAGGIIAYGLVSLIPDNWRINLGGSSKPKKGLLSNRPGADGPSGEFSIKKSSKSKSEQKSSPEKTSKKTTAPTTPEGQEAAELLKDAKKLLADKKTDEANTILERILNEFAETDAATEAEKLLGEQ
jgi:hypothetical protein